MKKLLLIVSLLFTMSASAIPLTALLNGGSITVGDKLFDQWEVLFEDSSDFAFNGIDTDSIDVTGLPDGGLDPGPGLHFEVLNDALSIAGDGIYAYLDFMFGFRVSVLNDDFLIKDNSLYLTDYELTDPLFLTSVYIEEKIYGDAGFSDNDVIGDKEAFAWDDGFGEVNQLVDSADFAPSNEIWVTKNILLEAIEFGESASLYSFEQRFSQVAIPEPSALLLFSLGLIAVAFKRKRA